MKEKGYFLLEGIILGILFLAVIPIAQLFGVAHIQFLCNEAEITAKYLGMEQISYIEAKNKEEIRISDSFNWLGKGETPVLINNNSFDIKTTIKNTDDERLKQIIVTVSWEIKGKKQEQVHRKLVECL